MYGVPTTPQVKAEHFRRVITNTHNLPIGHKYRPYFIEEA